VGNVRRKRFDHKENLEKKNRGENESRKRKPQRQEAQGGVDEGRAFQKEMERGVIGGEYGTYDGSAQGRSCLRRGEHFRKALRTSEEKKKIPFWNRKTNGTGTEGRKPGNSKLNPWAPDHRVARNAEVCEKIQTGGSEQAERGRVF